jgi:phytanoyl-CoA hydroxylase
MLSPEQIQQYQRDGFLVLSGLVERKTLDDLNKRFLDIVDGRQPVVGAMKIMQDVMVVKGAVKPQTPLHGVNKLFCLEDDDVLSAFARSPEVVSCVRSLIGDEIYSLTSNVFNKPPRVDGKHPLHQDLRYFSMRPASAIVAVWTAMLPTNRDNGCLAVIPGSHKEGILTHGTPDWDYVNHGFFGIDEVDRQRRQHVPMEPGDTLLFHPLLVHGSGRNRTDEFRRAISVHYASASCESPKGDWRTKPQVRAIV